MQAKCFRQGCPWVLDVAHMDDALDHLRQHYRAVHPTKGFRMRDIVETLESWNLTCDEVFERFQYGGIGPGGAPIFSLAEATHEIQRMRRTLDEGRDTWLRPETVVECEAKLAELVAAAPPQDPRPEPRRARRWRPGDVVANAPAVEWVNVPDPLLDPPLRLNVDDAFQQVDNGNDNGF